MKKNCSVLIIIVVANCQAFCALTEVNIEVDPVISHHYYYDEDRQLGDVEDRVNTIVLPEVTLAPGDIFRVNVSFADGKFLKVVNGADTVGITSHYLTGLLGNIARSKTNDASVGLDITSYQNVLNTTQSGTPYCYHYYQSTGEYSFGKGFYFERGDGAVIDGSLFGNFTVEFTAPTMVGGLPLSTKSYVFNSVRIKAFLFNTTVDKNVLVVVPEPGTILLLGLGAVMLRRKRY